MAAMEEWCKLCCKLVATGERRLVRRKIMKCLKLFANNEHVYINCVNQCVYIYMNSTHSTPKHCVSEVRPLA